VTDTELRGEGKAVRTVGRYEILREAGRGGTGIVYLARQVDLDRHVALKELAAFHAADPAFAERFLREARLAGSLNHPNIVTVHEYFEHGGTPFIAMEYFERGSLRPLVGSLSLPQVGGVLESLLAGLTAAEERRIVHRDLKPENVLVTARGGVKIADFGIAKALQKSPLGASLTSSGSTVGTPAYMAPELALGNEVGPWTDLYALGVVTYELLAGHVPFDRDEMPVAILLRHVHEAVPPLRGAVPSLDPRLAGWVERLLAKDSADRPASAAEAWDELEGTLIDTLGARWRRDAGLGPARPDAVRVTTTTPATNGRGATLARRRLGTRGARRGRRRWLLLGLAAAGAAGGLAAAVISNGGKDNGPVQTHSLRPRVAADVLLAPKQRLTAAVSGRTVFLADPRGRVVALDRRSLALRAVAADPPGPRSLSIGRGRVLVADGQTVTELSPTRLAPLAARAFGGASWVTETGSGPVAAAATGKRGRLCVLAKSGAGRCVAMPFAPSGLGASGDTVYAADAAAGTIVSFSAAHGLARVGVPVRVGPGPHGTVLAFRGRLYVPVQRGIAVVDLSRRVRRINLPVTPSSLWIVRRSGRLLAALPGVGEVALLDTAHGGVPTLIPVDGTPVAIAGGAAAAGGEEVVVVGSRGGRVTRLNAQTGAVLRSRSITQLVAAGPAPAVLRKATLARGGQTTTVALTLTGGRLDDSALRTPDLQIRDGHASVELWQGGIRSTVTSVTGGGLTLSVRRQPGRLAVSLGSSPGVYGSMAVAARSPGRILLSLTKAPVSTGGGTRAGGTSGTGGTSGSHTGGTGPTKKPKPSGSGTTGGVIQF
jgi:hypothetical protein